LSVSETHRRPLGVATPRWVSRSLSSGRQRRNPVAQPILRPAPGGDARYSGL